MADTSKAANATHTETLSPSFSNTHELKANDVKVVEAVQLAHDVSDTKYSPYTLSMLRLYGCLSIAYLCGCLNGYDGSLMGGLNGMHSYQNFFHMLVGRLQRMKP